MVREERSSLYSRQVDHPRSISTPSQMGYQSIATILRPIFHQASLTIYQYPFKLLGGERHGESKVFCLRIKHIDPGI